MLDDRLVEFAVKFRHYVSDPMRIGFGRCEIFWRLYVSEESHPCERIVDAGSVKFWRDAAGAFVRADLLVAAAERSYRHNVALDEIIADRLAVVDSWRQAYRVEVGEPFFLASSDRWVSDVVVHRPDGTQVVTSDLTDRRGRALRDRLMGSSPLNVCNNALAYGWSHVVEYDLVLWMKRVDTSVENGLTEDELLQK